VQVDDRSEEPAPGYRRSSHTGDVEEVVVRRGSSRTGDVEVVVQE
jgi:hypothetical protein